MHRDDCNFICATEDSKDSLHVYNHEVFRSLVERKAYKTRRKKYLQQAIEGDFRSPLNLLV